MAAAPRFAAFSALVLLLGCGTSEAGLSGGVAPVASSGAAPSASIAAKSASGASVTLCGERLKSMLGEPALPGAPEIEAHRIELSARPRGTPLLWKREPKIDPKAPGSAVSKLTESKRPLATVKGLVRRYGKSPETLRSIFLREGYVYASDPDLALALVETLRLAQLVHEPTVYLLRGSTVSELHRAERTRYLPERYIHADGALKGAVAELLLGDRIALSREEVLRDPAAIDLSEGARREGFDRLRVKHLTAAALVAEARYPGGDWVTAAFDIDGATMRLACVDGAGEALAARDRGLAASAPRRAALERLRDTVRAQVQEEPQFDEPKDEPDGEQQDGTLRREWRRAYAQGLRRYTIGDVTYDVYDAEGRAVPPQVCVDFITDTWERASGTWYAPLPASSGDDRPKPAPERKIGGIDFDKLDLPNRRSVAELLSFARKHTEMFEVLDVPQEERIPFTRKDELFEYLARRSDDFAPGDVLVIHGVKSDGRPHYHSVMIVENDPISGVPMLVAGNAGRPREQTLEGVMARSPKRAIKHRIRPKTEWLATSILGK